MVDCGASGRTTGGAAETGVQLQFSQGRGSHLSDRIGKPGAVPRVSMANSSVWIRSLSVNRCAIYFDVATQSRQLYGTAAVSSDVFGRIQRGASTAGRELHRQRRQAFTPAEYQCYPRHR